MRPMPEPPPVNRATLSLTLKREASSKSALLGADEDILYRALLPAKVRKDLVLGCSRCFSRIIEIFGERFGME